MNPTLQVRDETSVRLLKLPGFLSQRPLIVLMTVWVMALSISSTALAATFDREHRLLGLVLDRFVRNGLVDYAALKNSPRDLNQYLDSAAGVTEAEFQSWTANDQVAFLINLYNASTLILIVDNYPLKSIKDIGYVPHAAWRKLGVRYQGRSISLQTLEDDIIRANYPTYPGVHFALVCASMGCPPLRSEPYVGARLNEQLDEQARVFLADTNNNRVVAVRRTLMLSKIFKWYEEDFIRNGGSVVKYITPYMPEADQEDLKQESNWTVTYLEYDWRLNEVKPQKK